MRAGSRYEWLGLTTEPERELPVAVGTLRALRAGADLPVRPFVEAEVRRIDALIMHGAQRSWLRYLAEVTALITACAGDTGTASTLDAAETVLEHHRMLIGLPGPGYDRVSNEREDLARIVGELRERIVR